MNQPAHDRSFAEASNREIVVTRIFKAPRARVWEAFTDPSHVSAWWGPRGFTTTTSEMDVRPGGVWRFIMHGPDGIDYPNFILYREVAHLERLEFSHGEDEENIHFEMVVTFTDAEGGTEVTLRQIHPTAEARDYVVREFNAIEGAKETLARLGAYLETM